MTATAAEALELALWLHRAPARRAAVVGRPLPDGIGQLLRVAGGAPDQVAAAARIAGVEEATILEAVRFYLQQVLFHEDADAYRVLGLRHDASQERAREHHRLLQQWLHPDRSGQDAWESVYAVRINQAWGHLRTSQNRAAYDATIAATGSAAPLGGSRHGGERQAGRPVVAPVLPVPPGRSRNLTLVVLLGCVGLLVLIALRRETPPPWQEDRRSLAEVAEPATRGEDKPLARVGVVLTQAIDGLETAAATVEPTPTPLPITLPAPEPPVARVVVLAANPRTASVAPAATPGQIAAPDAPLPDAMPAAPAARTIAVASKPTQAPLPPPEVPAALQAPIVLAATATTPTQTPIPDAFDRMSQAQVRARDVLAYLGDPAAGLPPVWNDVPTMQRAERIRAALYGRHAERGRMRIELQAPQWRLSGEGARLESRYRAGAELGQIDLDFAWRESQLLVSSISLEPDI